MRFATGIKLEKQKEIEMDKLTTHNDRRFTEMQQIHQREIDVSFLMWFVCIDKGNNLLH